MKNDLLRVIIVDDSSIYRTILKKVLEKILSVELVGVAGNGELALEAIEKHRPDLVLLDVEMPVMDGLQALELIAKKYPDISVLMVSGVSDARRTLQALSLGAVDFIVKPEEGGGDVLRKHLLRGIRVVQAQRRLRERSTASKVSDAPVTRPESEQRCVQAAVVGGRESRLIVIGISTGGPRALEELLPALPKDLAAPILIVQHMPAGFTDTFAQSLDARSSLIVSEAKAGDEVVPGRVLIAPGGKHMEVVAGDGPDAPLVVSLYDGAPRNECKPSVDVLFDSVNRHYGGNILAAIMTGMGNDGCKSTGKLNAAGAYCITQSESSCVVYGMPRTVVEAGFSHEALPLRKIAGRMQDFSDGLISEAGP